jgi:hypothetical protein
MASGFLVLSDGRCFAPQWATYDGVLRLVIEQLDESAAEGELRHWLIALLPGLTDEPHVGYGPWLRTADRQLIERFLDLRELTGENQRRLHQAVLRAEEAIRSTGAEGTPEWLRNAVLDLADKVRRADRGEDPLKCSHWTKVVPSKGRRLGPGWGPSEPPRQPG